MLKDRSGQMGEGVGKGRLGWSEGITGTMGAFLIS